MNQEDSTTSIHPVYRRAAEILKKEGLRSLWFKILGETGYRRLDVFEKSLDTPGRPVAKQDDFEITLLSADEVDEFLAFRSYAPREKVLERLQRGELCHIVRCAGKMAHCSWSTTGEVRIDYLGCKCRLDPDAIYIYESYTAPQFRGKSLSALRSEIVHKGYREQGYRRYVSVSWPENRSAHRAIIKSGARISGRMGYWGFRSRKRFFLRNHTSRLPLQIMEKQPNRTKAHGESYWNKVPGGLDDSKHYLDPFLAELKRRENRRLVLEWGDLRPDSRILKTDAFEEAMGADSFLADLQTDNRSIIGMDLSSEIVKRASEIYSALGIGFLAADVRSLPISDASFCVVVSPSTLDHFQDSSDLCVSLAELFRVMKPGGRLVITLDNRQNLFDPLLKLVHRLGLVPYFIGRSYTVKELCSELRQAGFEVRNTTAILHNPRLVAVASMRLVRWLRWRPLIRLTEKLIIAAQRLENTWLCYYTGSFVAALAVRPVTDPQNRDS
jgi:SAM-dependent methyltransferase